MITLSHPYTLRAVSKVPNVSWVFQPILSSPLPPHILDGIHKSLDFTKSIDVTFWAVCLVAFFSFLRKSNLLAQSWEKFHPQKQLARQNISFTADGAIISVTWSKTIQFGQRKLSIPLPHIPMSKFCPSCAFY